MNTKGKMDAPELSEVSFGELRKLGEKLGYKAYKEAKFGIKNIQTADIIKRRKKNKPREESSKRQSIYKERKTITAATDPRFDSLYGTYNPNNFKEDYHFLRDVHINEKKALKIALLKEKNEKEKQRIKFLINRIENQEREEIKSKEQTHKQKQENDSLIKALDKGHKPYFRTKYEKKLVHLLDKYEDLKKTGKLRKHMKKKEKKKEG